jgi:catechol 2,3-dioxygenase-like lactoylglutathione lyase family enzyme
MLSDHQVYAAIPTADLDAARGFYEEVLGFVPREANPAGIYYDAGAGTYFVLTRSSGKASGSHTQMAFRVSDIESEVRALRQRGVRFEEYETPKTVDGIATIPIGRTAWFRDPEGNLIGMIQFND